MTEARRVGFGRDIHLLFSGFPLILGGVNIDSESGFNTHSDGDVLSHALVDALAGAIADGDLGVHFPENDPAAKDARSVDFVEEFMVRVREAGYEVENIDSFITLGTVVLRPFIEDIRHNLALAMGVTLEKVSVKARSNDGIPPEGTGEAASATVAVLLKSTKK